MNLRQRIDALIERHHQMLHRHEQRWQRVSVYQELLEAQMEARNTLAEERGWIVARTGFSLEQLRRRQAGRYRMQDYSPTDRSPFIDHPECYRESARPWRPAGLVTHAYLPGHEVVAYVEAAGLQAEVLPWSWYWPRRCSAVLIIPQEERPR